MATACRAPAWSEERRESTSPALRIGAQPYGVLPTTAFSRLAFGGRENVPGPNRFVPAASQARYLDVLATVLRVAERDWAAMATRATWLGQGGDPHRALLDTLGQHPASVEFHRRETESIEEHVNRLHMASGGLIEDILRALETIFRTAEIPQLLARLGVPVTASLPISQRIIGRSTFTTSGRPGCVTSATCRVVRGRTSSSMEPARG